MALEPNTSRTKTRGTQSLWPLGALLLGLACLGGPSAALAAPSGASVEAWGQVAQGPWQVTGQGASEVLGSGRLQWWLQAQGEQHRLVMGSSCLMPLTVDNTLTLTNMVTDTPKAQVVVPAQSLNAPVVVATWVRQNPRLAYRHRFYYHYQEGAVGVEHQPTSAYRLPLAPGVRARLMQGWHGRHSHQGYAAYAVDLQMPQGTAVLAMRDGLVASVHDRARDGGPGPEFKAPERANWVRVLHDDGTLGDYHHLMPGGVRVRLGQRVRAGQLLGLSGNTGYSTEAHLHFEVRRALSGKEHESVPFVWQAQAAPNPPEEPQQGLSYLGF